MEKSHFKVSSGYSLISVNRLREALGFTPSGMKKYLAALGVPIVDYADYRGHPSSDDDLYINSIAYELALLGSQLPESPAWDRIRNDPSALSYLMGTMSLIYGVPEREALMERLQSLGEEILTGTLRDMRIPGRKPVPGLKGKITPPPRKLTRYKGGPSVRGNSKPNLTESTE